MPSSRRAARAGIAAACLAAASGCSLFVSLDDVSGGSAADAGAGGPDATAEASDGAAAPDPEAGAKPGPPFCDAQTGALFCADFDAKDITASFAMRAQKNGIVTRVTTAFVSGTSSMEAALSSVSGANGEAAANASQSFTGGAVLVAEAKVRIDTRATPAPNAERFCELLTLEIVKSGGASLWQIGIRAQSVPSGVLLELFEYDPIATSTTTLGQTAVIQDAAWQTFRLRVDTAGRTAEVRRIDQDGSPVLATGTIAPPSVAFPTTWQVNAGLYASGPQSGWLVHFDDVLVRPP